MQDSQLEEAKRKHARILDYQKFFDSEHGKKVLEDLLWAHYIKCSFVPNDPHGTAFNEGQRSVIVRILHILKMDPNIIVKMIQEAQDGRNSNDGI